MGVRAAVHYPMSYDGGVRARAQRGLDKVLQRRNRIKTTVATTINSECEIIWQRLPALSIHCDTYKASEAVQRMFASLFYVELQSRPAKLKSPFSCQLAVKCRLARGSHLNAVVHTLLERSTKIYCEVSGAINVCSLCSDSRWQEYSSTGECFSHSIYAKIPSLDAKVKIRIDGIAETGTTLDISNSPVSFFDLLDSQRNLDATMVDDEDAATTFTDVGEPFGGTTVDDEDAATTFTDMGESVGDQISAIEKQLLELCRTA